MNDKMIERFVSKDDLIMFTIMEFQCSFKQLKLQKDKIDNHIQYKATWSSYFAVGTEEDLDSTTV